MKNAMRTACGAAILALATAGAAVADPVDELFFTQDAGWLDPLVSFDGSAGNTFSGFSGALGPDAPANTYTTMAWKGTGSAESSIELSTFDDDTALLKFGDTIGVADDNDEWNEGDWWQITNLTQTNRALNLSGISPNPLWVADTLANLRIFDDEARTNAVEEDLDSVVQIEFWETFNVPEASGNDCFSPAPLGTRCDDIYRIKAADFAPISFELGGYLYTIEFLPVPGPSKDADGIEVGQSLICPSPDPRCADAGTIPEGQIWAFTPEFNPGTSSIDIVMRWTAVAIPEPAMLGLFGAGILGLGFAGRRRRNA